MNDRDMKVHVWWCGKHTYRDDDKHRQHELGDLLVDVPELGIQHHLMVKDIPSNVAYSYIWLVQSAYLMGVRHGEEMHRDEMIERLGLHKGPKTEIPYEFKRQLADGLTY